jgi:hypothetical protein
MAWKLDLHLADVGRWFSPAVGVAFIDGRRRRRHRAAAAPRRHRGAIAAAGPWRVLRVRWGSAPRGATAP